MKKRADVNDPNTRPKESAKAAPHWYRTLAPGASWHWLRPGEVNGIAACGRELTGSVVWFRGLAPRTPCMRCMRIRWTSTLRYLIPGLQW